VFDLNGFRAVVRGDVHGYFLKDFAARGEWLLGALLLIAEASAVIVAPSITGRREFLSNTAVEVRAPGPEVKRLSERELHVLALLLQGRSDQEVATELSIALGTVETHVHNISLKLGARSRIHLGLLASRAGLP
jgi:DNA-binding NarL/FixJ family response regulator